MTNLVRTPRTELAHRSDDGLEVTLSWAQKGGEDEVVVSVADLREGTYFEIRAEPSLALAVDHGDTRPAA